MPFFDGQVGLTDAVLYSWQDSRLNTWVFPDSFWLGASVASGLAVLIDVMIRFFNLLYRFCLLW